jgi:voltage-gated sodium channel
MSNFAAKVVNSSLFKNAIIAVIFLTALVVGLETSESIYSAHGPLLRFIDKLILGIFIVEIILKMVAQSPKPLHFFRDPWNVFDFIIVAICLLPLNSGFATVLRLARVLRVLRLVTALPKLQLLVGALLKSIPSMGYVGLLLSVLFYIYGVTGVFFFSKGDPLHFGTLPDALLTLFGVITLEGWTTLMYDLLRGDVEISPIKVVGYFLSFVMFGTMIMLNLFIGVIMNSMQEMNDERAMDRLNSKSAAATLEAIEKDLVELKIRVRAARESL